MLPDLVQVVVVVLVVNEVVDDLPNIHNLSKKEGGDIQAGGGGGLSTPAEGFYWGYFRRGEAYTIYQLHSSVEAESCGEGGGLTTYHTVKIIPAK